MTFKILTDDTRKIIFRSRVRLSKDGENNLKLDVKAGEAPERFYIKSKRDDEGDDIVLPTINAAKNPIDFDDSPSDKSIPSEKGESIPPEEGESKIEPPKNTPPSLRTPTVETITEDDDDDYESPMNPESLRDEPMVDDLDPEELQAPHQRTPDPKKPVDFTGQNLENPNPTVKGLPPEDLINHSVLLPPNDDGSRDRTKILKIVGEYKDGVQNHPDYPQLVKFKCLTNKNQEQVLLYNDIASLRFHS